MAGTGVIRAREMSIGAPASVRYKPVGVMQLLGVSMVGNSTVHSQPCSPHSLIFIRGLANTRLESRVASFQPGIDLRYKPIHWDLRGVGKFSN